MPYVRDSYWRGRQWANVADMQAGAAAWCAEVAGVRSHRSLDGASPLSIFEALEAPVLMALPRQVFELASWSNPKVGVDCHAKVGHTIYSVPWRLIGKRLDAREGDRSVEFFDDGDLVKTWPRAERGKRTDNADYPPDKIAFFMRTPVWCRRRAAELGSAVSELVNSLLENQALHRLRAAQGVVGLADKYGAARLDAACRRAIAVGDPGYRTVKGILAAGTEHDGEVEPTAPTAPAHLHGRTGLFEHLGEGAAAG